MQRRNSVTSLWRTVLLVRRTAPIYTLTIVPLSILQGILPAIQLYISKLLLDRVANILQSPPLDTSFRYLIVLLMLQGTIELFGVSLSTLQRLYESLLGERLSHSIQRKILVKASEMNLASFEDGAFYDQMQNAHQEAGTRPLQMISQARGAIQAFVVTVSLVVILLSLSWWILPILMITSIPSFYIQAKYGNLNYWMLRHRMPDLRKQRYFSYILRRDWLIKELKLFRLEGYFLGRFNELFEKFYAETSRLYKRRTWGQLAGLFISVSGVLASLLFVISAVIARTITVGDFSLYAGTIRQFQGRVSTVLNSVSELYSSSLFLSNLFEFLDQPSSGLDDGEDWTELITSVEFKMVGFQYPGSNKFVLKDISFFVEKGQSLGIVGRNGAGKTTLIKLISVLYRPTHGSILFNSKDISCYSTRSLQKHISVTFQDFGKYELTARENIELGRVNVENEAEKVDRVAAKADVDEDLTGLPEGYDSQLGRWFEGGQQLSGGQWQKVALARSYYRDASVIVLDEPTSALDPESEYEVYQTVQEQKREKIIVLISHRFSAVRSTTEIIVLENGRIREKGSHEELFETEGFYKDQFELQAQGYR